MEVIAGDLTPIIPHTTQYVSLATGKQMAKDRTRSSPRAAQSELLASTSSHEPCKQRLQWNGNTEGNFSYKAKLSLPPNLTVAPVHYHCFDELAENSVPFVPYQSMSPVLIPGTIPSPFLSNNLSKHRCVFCWSSEETTQNADCSTLILQQIVQGNISVRGRTISSELVIKTPLCFGTYKTISMNHI
jgi:hypothetical protein